MGWDFRCEVCGASCQHDHDACTNRRCGKCHRALCTPGGVTTPGHGRGSRQALKAYKTTLKKDVTSC